MEEGGGVEEDVSAHTPNPAAAMVPSSNGVLVPMVDLSTGTYGGP